MQEKKMLFVFNIFTVKYKYLTHKILNLRFKWFVVIVFDFLTNISKFILFSYYLFNKQIFLNLSQFMVVLKKSGKYSVSNATLSFGHSAIISETMHSSDALLTTWKNTNCIMFENSEYFSDSPVGEK